MKKILFLTLALCGTQTLAASYDCVSSSDYPWHVGIIDGEEREVTYSANNGPDKVADLPNPTFESGDVVYRVHGLSLSPYSLLMIRITSRTCPQTFAQYTTIEDQGNGILEGCCTKTGR